MKNPVFSINNTSQKVKLKTLISILFPNFTYVKIKKNGMIKLGVKVLFDCIPIVQQVFHISELCITQFPEKLSQYRQGNINYTKVYNEYLEYIIYNKKCNVIDFLYTELQKIKSSSKVETLLEDSQLFLKESQSDSITIGTIITETRNNHIPQYSKLNKTINYLTGVYPKESIQDKYSRTSFISSNRCSGFFT